MSEELKPCPFCGEIGKAHLDICGDNLYRVRCINCGVDTHTGWEERIYPIDRWNTRPIEDTLRKQLAIANDLLIRLEIATNLTKSIYQSPLHAFNAVHEEVIKAQAEIEKVKNE
jgi:hypothetical protein